KKSLRQMDSIPAFVRRGTKEPLHVEESEGASTEPAEELKEARVQTIPVYSKPDELDHVLWKKDATRLEREVVEDIEVQTKEPIEADKGETVSRPSPLELDPKPHLVEAIEETGGEQEVEQPYVKEEKIPAERDIPFEE